MPVCGFNYTQTQTLSLDGGYYSSFVFSLITPLYGIQKCEL